MAPRKTATNSTEETLFDRLMREVKVPDPLRVTEDIVLYCPTKAQLDESQSALTELDSNKILLGEDNYKKLDELFGPEAPQLWAEFNKAYVTHFFPTQSG
jgi:hypothetical protein